MKLETFFEKFDELADTPDGVTKLRQLVLELAVQGRLVAQDSRDESVAEELAELDLGILELDPRFAIPANWVWAPLEPLLLMMKNGFNGKPNKLGGHYKVTRIETISRGTIDMSRVGFADELPPEVVEKHLIQNGDILFSHINSEPHLGKTAICTFDDPTLIHGVNLLLLRTKPQIDPQFLNTAFKELRFSGYFVSIAQRAINQSSINQKNLGKTLIPLPPLAEQKRIVAKVDELMALCDRLEAQQQERETRHAALARASLARFADAPTPANLPFLFHPSYAIPPADLRKSILTLAVQGKLVPQDPNDEPAERGLGDCGVDLKRWAVAKEEERQDVPSSWTWIRFAGVGEQRLGKMLDAQKNKGESKSYLRNTNVQWMRFELDDVKEMRVEEREEEELRLKHGDLLICEGGEPGRCAIWRDDVPEMYFQKALHRVRPCDAILSEFLALNLQIDCRNEVLAGYFTGATIKHLTGRSLSAYPIPIPPLAEQRRIVAKVEQLMALVDALDTQLAASRATAANLLSALVAELTAA